MGDHPRPKVTFGGDSAETMASHISEGRKEYRRFLEKHTCYDLIPQSSKMIVFDTQLLVKKAFFALLQNEVRSAPVWDHNEQRFVGMITITDFINVLLQYYHNNKMDESKVEELEGHKISTWRESLQLPNKLLSIGPEDNLLKAVTSLLSNRIHRLPVLDPKTGNALFIITHKRLLLFLAQHFDKSERLKFLDYKLEELGIGVNRKAVHTVHEATPLVSVLETFVDKRVSALPVIDDNGEVTNLYAKFDVINLARDRAYAALDVTVKEALEQHRNKGTDAVVHTCTADESLRDVITRIVEKKVHRLVVVDADRKVTGVVSLSDLFQFLTGDE